MYVNVVSPLLLSSFMMSVKRSKRNIIKLLIYIIRRFVNPLLYDKYCKCKLFIQLRSIGTPDVATCTVAVDSFVFCNMYDRNCLKPWVFVLWIQWRSFRISYKWTMKKIDEYWSCCLCSRPLFKATCPFKVLSSLWVGIRQHPGSSYGDIQWALDILSHHRK